MSRTHSLRGWSRAFALALAALGVGACADLRRATGFGGNEANIESPVAPAVLAASRARLVTPRFTEIPPAPINPPSPATIKRRVGEEVAERRTLDAWTAAHPPMTANTEGFAAAGRSQAAQGGEAPVGDHTAAAEAWAAQVRASALPPAPPQ